MIGFTEAVNTMLTRGFSISTEDYLFALLYVLGNGENDAYSFAYDRDELMKNVGTDEESEYLSKNKKAAESKRSQPNITHLIDLLSDSYREEIQKAAFKLSDVKFSGNEAIQILNDILKSRIQDIDSASVKDVVQIIKTLIDQGGLDVGDGGFSKHFVQIFPKFNALCTNCGREFDAMRGLSAKCPFCDTVYNWSESDNRYYPEVETL